MGIIDTIKTTISSQDQSQGQSQNVKESYMGYGGDGMASAFIQDIYNEEHLTPHEKMRHIRHIRETNLFIEKGINDVANLLLGKDQKIVCDDEDIQRFYNEQFIEDSKLIDTMRICAMDFLSFGNYYFEKKRGIKTGKPRRVVNLAHPEWIWRQMKGDKIISYIQEMPEKLAKGEGLQRYRVGYGKYWKRDVYGVKYSTDRVYDGAMGQATVPFYGRSPLASAINDHKILKEIERNMAINSRYKSIPKKIISLYGPDGQPLSGKDYLKTLRDWQSLNDYQNFVTNGKEFTIEDLDYAGNTPNYENMIDYFKRKLTSSLAPEFYMHGETTRYSVSHDQKTTFYLCIESWRQQFIQPFNQFLEDHAKAWNLNVRPVIQLGAFDFETDDERKQKALESFNAGILTVDETREMLGLEAAEDQAVGQSYSWELKSQEPAAMLQQKLNDLAEEHEQKD